MTPLHLLPLLLTMPLISALLTSLIPNPAASRNMTQQLPPPPWPMAFTCRMALLQQTVMASDVNMSVGHQPQPGALECITALVHASPTSKLMTVLGTLACCGIPLCRFLAMPVAAMQPDGAPSSGSALHGCVYVLWLYRLFRKCVCYWLYAALQGRLATS